MEESNTVALIRAKKQRRQAEEEEKKARKQADDEALNKLFEPIMQIYEDSKGLQAKPNHRRFTARKATMADYFDLSSLQPGYLVVFSYMGEYSLRLLAQMDHGTPAITVADGDTGAYRAVTMAEAKDLLLEEIAGLVILEDEQ